MQETAPSALKIAAGIFLTLALITIVVIITMSAMDSGKQAQAKMSGITNTISSTEYNFYSNATMSGSQVMNAARQYMNDPQFGVKIVTGKGATTYYGNTFNEDGTVEPGDKNNNLQTAENPSLATYVNPSGKFNSNVVRDSNDVIVGIVFNQL